MRLTLLAMPWASPTRPAGAMGALASYVRQQLPDVDVRVCSEYVEVSVLLGESLYDAISGDGDRVGEMMYASLFHTDRLESARQAFVAWSRQLRPHDRTAAATFDFTQKMLAVHVATTAAEVADCDVLGLSCGPAQIFANVLLARAVKQRNPDCVIALGGPSVASGEGRALLCEHPFLDFVIPGDGKRPLVSLLEGELAEVVS
jgi:hypothetical protein